MNTLFRKSIELARVASCAAALILVIDLGAAARADEAAAKSMVKAMSDYLAAQTTISFNYDTELEVVTKDRQKLLLVSSGAMDLSRPDKFRGSRHGGFADVEMVFDGKTLTLLGNDANLYTQLEIPARSIIWSMNCETNIKGLSPAPIFSCRTSTKS